MINIKYYNLAAINILPVFSTMKKADEEDSFEASLASTEHKVDLIEVIEILYNSKYLTFYELVSISLINPSFYKNCYHTFGAPNACIENCWPYKSDFINFHPNSTNGTRFGMNRYHEILAMELQLLDIAMSYRHSIKWQNDRQKEASTNRERISSRNLIGVIPGKKNTKNRIIQFGQQVLNIINKDINADLLYCVLETFSYIESFDLVKEEVVTEKTRKNPKSIPKRPNTAYVNNSIGKIFTPTDEAAYKSYIHGWKELKDPYLEQKRLEDRDLNLTYNMGLSLGIVSIDLTVDVCQEIGLPMQKVWPYGHYDEEDSPIEQQVNYFYYSLFEQHPRQAIYKNNCSNCSKGDASFKCSKCSELGLDPVVYCSKECQAEHFRHHKFIHKYWGSDTISYHNKNIDEIVKQKSYNERVNIKPGVNPYIRRLLLHRPKLRDILNKLPNEYYYLSENKMKDMANRVTVHNKSTINPHVVNLKVPPAASFMYAVRMIVNLITKRLFVTEGMKIYSQLSKTNINYFNAEFNMRNKNVSDDISKSLSDNELSDNDSDNSISDDDNDKEIEVKFGKTKKKVTVGYCMPQIKKIKNENSNQRVKNFLNKFKEEQKDGEEEWHLYDSKNVLLDDRPSGIQPPPPIKLGAEFFDAKTSRMLTRVEHGISYHLGAMKHAVSDHWQTLLKTCCYIENMCVPSVFDPKALDLYILSRTRRAWDLLNIDWQTLNKTSQTYVDFKSKVCTIIKEKNRMFVAHCIAVSLFEGVEAHNDPNKADSMLYPTQQRKNLKYPTCFMSDDSDPIMRCSDSDYYNSLNSFITVVAKRKRGIPITIATIFTILAGSIGFSGVGVIHAPWHVLIGIDAKIDDNNYKDSDGNSYYNPYYYDRPHEKYYIDPFRPGIPVVGTAASPWHNDRRSKLPPDAFKLSCTPLEVIHGAGDDSDETIPNYFFSTLSEIKFTNSKVITPQYANINNYLHLFKFGTINELSNRYVRNLNQCKKRHYQDEPGKSKLGFKYHRRAIDFSQSLEVLSALAVLSYHINSIAICKRLIETSFDNNGKVCLDHRTRNSYSHIINRELNIHRGHLMEDIDQLKPLPIEETDGNRVLEIYRTKNVITFLKPSPPQWLEFIQNRYDFFTYEELLQEIVGKDQTLFWNRDDILDDEVELEEDEELDFESLMENYFH